MTNYSPLARFTLKLVRLKKRKRKVYGNTLSTPCVYLCRHRDMNGVIDAFSDLRVVLRPWVLECFCSYKSAKRQLREYTFPQKMKKGKAFSYLASPVCARVINMYVKSVRGIPVYRQENAGKSVCTIKQSVRALEEGDSILIFIDKDYTDTAEQSEGEIYKGFKTIDKLYNKRNGKHIPFVPVYANGKEARIHSPVSFECEKEDDVFAKIVYGIYNP